jgi:hypothetical protein
MAENIYKFTYHVQIEKETIFNSICEVKAPSINAALFYGFKEALKDYKGRVLEIIKIEKVI